MSSKKEKGLSVKDIDKSFGDVQDDARAMHLHLRGLESDRPVLALLDLFGLVPERVAGRGRDGRHEPDAAQRGQAGPHLQGHVAGLSRAQSLARAVQDARARGGLAPGTGPPAAPAGGPVKVQRELS